MLNKYEIVETIAYEGESIWKVFARSPEEAKYMVSQHRGYMGEPLSYRVIKPDIKGTKYCRIINYHINVY